MVQQTSKYKQCSQLLATLKTVSLAASFAQNSSSDDALFKMFFEFTAENCLSILFPLVLQNRQKSWKNKAIKFYVLVHMAR